MNLKGDHDISPQVQFQFFRTVRVALSFSYKAELGAILGLLIQGFFKI